jgi:hypothetical protein
MCGAAAELAYLAGWKHTMPASRVWLSAATCTHSSSRRSPARAPTPGTCSGSSPTRRWTSGNGEHRVGWSLKPGVRDAIGDDLVAL